MNHEELDEDDDVFEMTVKNNKEVWDVLNEFDLVGSVVTERTDVMTLEFLTTQEFDRAREALLTADAWPDGHIPKTAGGN